ncbi:V-set and transmembrane domain-containing protein 4a isoform X3 [Corythoichthys intestinalis]|uniref:V-set and transmembrane domain-containing protein 4a isoform X3 n=1 Tax=Corythoichthys intestinalis TaxID=161448 RepID=UPI0025A65EB5|nr:V-set and transmembrane domain-containing protein 4a isoform X3 [Corythoichthys intestinalis]
MYISVVLLVLTKVLLIEVCHALNVTVIPGPVVSATERDNLTLSCLVSQRKTSTSTLVLRWFFSPQTSHSPVHLLPPPSPSPTTAPESSQVLIVKMGIKKIKLYGNYTRGFSQPKFRLYEQIEGEAYRLVILNVSGTDRGFYTCRVHEIRKYRNIWRASSNGSSTTQLTVHFTLEARRGEGIWRLLSASYLLVKCPESSSGETVTSTSSSSSSSPRPQNKYTKHQSDVKVALKPPKLPEDPPPQTPEKVPVASKRPQKPKRSKAPRRSQPRAHQEESLTYAELELVRPTVEPPASTCPDLEPSNPDTVYAQILFQEKQL